MGRLIDADALKATLGMKNDCTECKDTWKACHCDRIYSKMFFCGWIDDAPTVHPEQPKIGKWVWLSSTYDRIPCEMRFWCDQCHHEVITHNTSPWEKYCPNCGAKMEGAD